MGQISMNRRPGSGLAATEMVGQPDDPGLREGMSLDSVLASSSFFPSIEDCVWELFSHIFSGTRRLGEQHILFKGYANPGNGRLIRGD